MNKSVQTKQNDTKINNGSSEILLPAWVCIRVTHADVSGYELSYYTEMVVTND